MKIRLDEWLKREFYPPPAIRTARQTNPPRHGALHNIARLTLENGSSNIAIRNRLRAVFACEMPEVCCATGCEHHPAAELVAATTTISNDSQETSHEDPRPSSRADCMHRVGRRRHVTDGRARARRRP
ncbi:hypothetical protein C0Z19_27370 [Trinickia soli]|uniref:Uncharacterized protein n=1 Tax=Trinickia soli TaxID=380675 RepID=A0A2N7VEE5_9BURK|nr:hypothetical protein C0Z19_27370 [Trinickia soli]